MKHKFVKSSLAVAALCGALMAGNVSANQDQFSALGGVEAQALSSQEMDAIHGALTATQIQDAYFKLLDALVVKYPTLANYVDLLKARFTTYTFPRLVTFFGL